MEVSGLKKAIGVITTPVRRTETRVMDGKTLYTENAKIIKPGLKHIIVRLKYANKVTSYVNSTSIGDLEGGKYILSSIPKSLQNAFHDLVGAESSKRFA